MWNANLMHQGNFIDVFLALHVSGAVLRAAVQRLSRPPSIHKLGAENHMLQLNI